MSEQTTQTEPSAAIQAIAVGKWIDEEFVRRFREEFDRAEQAKAENKRRLEARLADLRAQRAGL